MHFKSFDWKIGWTAEKKLGKKNCFILRELRGVTSSLMYLRNQVKKSVATSCLGNVTHGEACLKTAKKCQVLFEWTPSCMPFSQCVTFLKYILMLIRATNVSTSKNQCTWRNKCGKWHKKFKKKLKNALLH